MRLVRHCRSSLDHRETYSHLREHSNSVFIVLCEISLSGLIITAISVNPSKDIARSLWGQANRLESALKDSAAAPNRH
jgi:hypothetical protein